MNPILQTDAATLSPIALFLQADWVVKGVIVCRQPVLDITTLGEGKQSRCKIMLEPRVIRTAPLARRPFQGWRYFEPKDVPPDLDTLDAGEAPEELVRQLRELGAW